MQYPRLTYPEMYILEGGYSSFFKFHRSRCFPQNYVEMNATEHEDACEQGMAKVQRRKPLSRAQTYAGPSCLMEDSPTALGRSSADTLFGLRSCGLLDPRPMHSRRMASY